MEKWLRGDFFEVDYGYFELGLAEGIYNLFSQNRQLLSHELVYYNFAKHYNLKPNDMHNGFFIGFINLVIQKGTLIKTDVKCFDGRYSFYENKASQSYIDVGIKVAKEKAFFNDFRAVMYAAYEVEGSVVESRDIHQKLRRKITSERVKEILDYVLVNSLLKNSDWTIDKNDTGYTITKNNVIDNVLDSVVKLSKEQSVIRSWMVQRILHIPKSNIERIFLILNNHLMFPSALKFNKHYRKWDNVITVK